ncbi:MAG: hypothetical protein ACT6Q8_00600 [Niveispirillum sp.]|uniref:hypothetical protein n=1 Tax=Niveispirillum sp. TaxID=1917217 RepID=UPI00403580E8
MHDMRNSIERTVLRVMYRQLGTNLEPEFNVDSRNFTGSGYFASLSFCKPNVSIPDGPVDIGINLLLNNGSVLSDVILFVKSGQVDLIEFVGLGTDWPDDILNFKVVNSEANVVDWNLPG